jgi:hypothetical protein
MGIGLAVLLLAIYMAAKVIFGKNDLSPERGLGMIAVGAMMVFVLVGVRHLVRLMRSRILRKRAS